MDPIWHSHRRLNRLQSALLILSMLGIAAMAGSLLLGETGAWLAAGVALMALLIEPTTSSALTLRLYRARPLHPAEAPGLWALLRQLAKLTGLPAVPVPHYVPSQMINAFATGSRQRAAIVVTDGLLRTLTPRELTGVLAHEVAHIAHDDLRVMGLADSVSRLTSLLALLGQLILILSLPWFLLGEVSVSWPAWLLLALAPHLTLLAQLGLSRVREFDADLMAARLTGDPQGLASALARIEQVSRSWRHWLLPGWGNPEPSWLRTHPATAARIKRLHALSTPGWSDLPTPAIHVHDGWPCPPHAPRWYPGGYWR